MILPEISRQIKMVMYADDTTLYCNLGDLSENIINNELTKVSELLAANKLSLNVKKTKYMMFHTPQKKVTYPELKINNILIERVSEFSFLDIIFNSNLKKHPHINYFAKKNYGNCWTIVEIKRPISDDCIIVYFYHISAMGF